MQTTSNVTKRRAKSKMQKAASARIPKMDAKGIKGNSIKMNGGGMKSALDTIQALIDSQPDLVSGLKEVVDTEKHIYDVSSKQIIKVAKYLKANWKTVVPALAVLGVGATFLRGGGKSRRH